MSTRNIPSVDQLIRDPEFARWPLWVRTLAVKHATGEVRSGELRLESLRGRITSIAHDFGTPNQRAIINLTGVVLHTGLGRARLWTGEPDLLGALGSHSSVELDIPTGKRGDRQADTRKLLQHLTAAESSLIVNNCAGAVVLVLSALAKGKEVVLSRGRMVEIGGSFRIPDVVRASGCRLREIGCTNKTHISDYRDAITEKTAAILVCHPSNFVIRGFEEHPPVEELAALARERCVPLVVDLGSGCLIETRDYGLPHEPTLQEVLGEGADLVLCSGDKLLGGPQAGLILGKKGLVDRAAKHPLARALRIDKLTAAALTATLRLYADGRQHQIPVWKYLRRDMTMLSEMAEKLAQGVQNAEIIDAQSAIGGGSMPAANLPTKAVQIKVSGAESLATKLRLASIVGRVEKGAVILDPRCAEDDEIAHANTILQGILGK